MTVNAADVVLQKYPSLAEAVKPDVFIDPVCQLTCCCKPSIDPVVLLIVPPVIPAVEIVPAFVVVVPDGQTNTGGGGGATGANGSQGDSGNGGSGMVVIRYKFQ